MIGIIGAMEIEVSALKAMIENPVVKKISGVEFVSGKIYNKEVVVATCGVGKVFSAISAEAMILTYSPDIIINSGVAGSTDERLGIADIVVASDVVQHDMDTTFFGDEPGFISVINKIYFEADEKLKQAADQAAEALQIPHRIGRIVTGDQFIANAEKKDWLVKQFQGDCTEMEGCAIAQACYMNNVPFVIIRAISDGASDGAPMQYEEFVNLAAARAMQLIGKMTEYI